jgi:hypothetical protein
MLPYVQFTAQQKACLLTFSELTKQKLARK